MNEIVARIEKDMNKAPYLKEILGSLKEVRVQMKGQYLFEDTMVDKIELEFECNGETIVVQDFSNEVFIKYVYQKLNVTSVSWQTFEMDYPELNEEAEEAQKIVNDWLETDLQEKLMDFYIDQVHDYATGEIKSFAVEFTPSPVVREAQ